LWLVFSSSAKRLIHLVVLGNVLVESFEHNHRNNPAQEKDDHERVDEGEDVNLVIGVSGHVNVPAVGPDEIAGNPIDIIGVKDLRPSLRVQQHEVGRIVDGGRKLGASLERNVLFFRCSRFGELGLGAILELVRDGVGNDLKPHNTSAIKDSSVFMVPDGYSNVIVKVVRGGGGGGGSIFGFRVGVMVNLETNWKGGKWGGWG